MLVLAGDSQRGFGGTQGRDRVVEKSRIRRHLMFIQVMSADRLLPPRSVLIRLQYPISIFLNPISL